MELEFFCKPDTDLEWFDYWKAYCKILIRLRIKRRKFKFRDHEKEELSFYSKATCDVEYKFPFGWGELGVLQTVQIVIYLVIWNILKIFRIFRSSNK